MSSMLSVAALTDLSVIPIGMPQVEIPNHVNGTSLATVNLRQGQSFDICYVCLHFIGFRTIGYLGKINDGMPMVHLGLYYQEQGSDGSYGGYPLWHVGLNAPGVTAKKSQLGLSYSAPGTYRFVLINNSASSSVAVTVSGCAQISNVN